MTPLKVESLAGVEPLIVNILNALAAAESRKAVARAMAWIVFMATVVWMLNDKLAEIALQGKSYFCGISTEMSSGTGPEGTRVNLQAEQPPD